MDHSCSLLSHYSTVAHKLDHISSHFSTELFPNRRVSRFDYNINAPVELFSNCVCSVTGSSAAAAAFSPHWLCCSSCCSCCGIGCVVVRTSWYRAHFLRPISSSATRSKPADKPDNSQLKMSCSWKYSHQHSTHANIMRIKCNPFCPPKPKSR